MDLEHKFDLQLFAEGGPDSDTGNDGGATGDNPDSNAGADAGAATGAVGDSATPPAADSNAGADASGENGRNSPDGAKPGTILGGKPGESAGGVPEAYDFKSVVPEGMQYDEKSSAAFGAVAKEMNLTQEQAGKLAAFGMNYMSDGLQAATAQRMAEQVSWGEQTKKELGPEYDAIVSKAGSGIEALERKIPGIRQALNDTGAGNRIEFVRAFAALGELTSEDNFRGFGEAFQNDEIYGNTDFSKY